MLLSVNCQACARLKDTGCALNAMPHEHAEGAQVFDWRYHNDIIKTEFRIRPNDPGQFAHRHCHVIQLTHAAFDQDISFHLFPTLATLKEIAIRPG